MLASQRDTAKELGGLKSKLETEVCFGAVR